MYVYLYVFKWIILFVRFKQLCEDAYMVLRKHRRLIVTMFRMMVNVGIPELQDLKAVEHLDTTLKPEATDVEARRHIRDKIEEAMKESWKTKWHEKFHIMKHHRRFGGFLPKTNN